MGTGLIGFYRERIPGSWKTAFFSAFFIGLLVHLYKFTNTLYIRDSILNTYTSQNIVGSGRWFLSIACAFSSWFDLPWVNGLFSLALIGAAAAVTVDFFRMENPAVILLTGGFLAAFPAVTATFFYEFTADGYMLAMLLAALTARFTRMGDRSGRHLAAAAVCLCLSCGTYQAYVSFALMLSICHFLQELLEGRRSTAECFRWIGRQAAVYGAGLAAYYGIWKLCMRLENVSATDYQGIDQVGRLSAGTLLGAVGKSLVRLREFLLDWDILSGGWTVYALLNALFLLALAVAVLTAVFRSGLLRRPAQLGLFLLAAAAIPFAACIWYFTSPDVVYHPLMLQSLAVVYIWAALLYDRWFSVRLSTLAGGLLAVLVVYFGIQANISYFFLNRCGTASAALSGEVISRIHLLTEEETPTLAIIGRTFDHKRIDGEPGARAVHNMSQLLQTDILYDQGHLALFMKNVQGFDFVYASPEEKTRLERSAEVAEMGCWPSPDAVKLIDGVVVVKLAEPA